MNDTIYGLLIIIGILIVMVIMQAMEKDRWREEAHRQKELKGCLIAEIESIRPNAIEAPLLRARYEAVKIENEGLKEDLKKADMLLKQTKVERLGA